MRAEYGKATLGVRKRRIRYSIEGYMTVSILNDLSAGHINAFWAWAVENGMTPEIVVFVSGDPEKNKHIKLPSHLLSKEAGITLNIGPNSTDRLVIRGEGISFSTRFSGKGFAVEIPIESVVGYKCRELPDMLIATVSYQASWKRYIEEKLGAAAGTNTNPPPRQEDDAKKSPNLAEPSHAETPKEESPVTTEQTESTVSSKVTNIVDFRNRKK